ncbi:MAG: transporter substrate-binding domain-containing protein, partial [Desulfuromonadaceae bacterium]
MLRRCMINRLLPILVLFILGIVMPACGAVALAETKVLRVGTKEAPPFAMKDEDGQWSGLSIDLWRQVAADLGIAYELQEHDISGLLAGIEEGSLDVAVAALTITAQREERMDFTHPFYSSGLGIAVRAGDKGGWFRVLERIFSPEFFKVLASLALVLLFFGGLVWLFERRKNPDQFGGGSL